MEHASTRVRVEPHLLCCTRRCSEFRGVGPLEHIAASLLIAGHADWCLIIQGGEIPLLDGSAQCIAITKATSDLSQRFVPSFDFCVRTSWGGSLAAKASKQFRVTSRYRGEVWVADQLNLKACLDARTFIEMDALATACAQGLLRGCVLGQGRILGPAKTEAGIAMAHQLGLNPSRTVMSGDARMEAECAAHKVLDLVGDLALWIGALPALDIEMENVGHKQFHQLGKGLLSFAQVASMS